MEPRNPTLHRAKCKHPGCRFEVVIHDPIAPAPGESREEECRDGHKERYTAIDVRSWSNPVTVGRD